MARTQKDGNTRGGGKPSLRWRLLKAWLALVVLGAAAGGAVYGLGRLDTHVRAMPMYQMTRESLRLVEGPSWMTPAILADLDVRDRLPERFSLLDPDVCLRVARAYEEVAWVERVERVEKRDPRVNPADPPLEVRLRFRCPVAFVEGDRGTYLVDAEGVRLPGVYPSAPRLGQATLLVIRGAHATPPQPGRQWLGGGVLAGVRVAEAVSPQRQVYQVTTIDVENFGGRRNPRDTEIALYTRSGTRIKWGKAPSAEAELLQEKTLAEKVAYLNYVYERLGGRVDGVLEYIDVPNETIRRRATSLTTRLRS